MPTRWFAAVALAIAVVTCRSRRAEAEPAPAGEQPATHVVGGGEDEAARVRLVRQMIRGRLGDPAFAAQLVQLTADLSPTAGAALFAELADENARAGEFNEAAIVCQAIVERYPDEPAALAATRRLVDLYASAEAACSQQPQTPGKAVADEDSPPANPYASYLQYALTAANQAIARRKEWGDDPALALATYAAQRKLHGAGSASALRPVKRLPPGNPWGDAARIEAWLADPRGETPDRVVPCPATDPPTLDGQLDDACWSKGTALPLGAAGLATEQAANEPTAELRVAWDAEYLYLALQADRLPTAHGAAPTGANDGGPPRTHDSASFRRERVRLLVDVDRDYASWFELTVDDRGHTADAAWGAARWNPEWFVAALGNDERWQCEAAIPWGSLAPRAPTAGEAWALAAERLRPAAGPPAPPQPTPAAFVVLRFD
ncbi:MAG: hypothetical protein KF847_01015 [Pirellulales bacterium]|nr:hypothetical protein [Pirellulales bacterium]